MNQAKQKPSAQGIPAVNVNMTPVDTARYTGEMLAALRKIAASQGQGVLAHLLELARFEAHTLAVTTTTPDSPGDGRSGPPAPAPAKP